MLSAWVGNQCLFPREQQSGDLFLVLGSTSYVGPGLYAPLPLSPLHTQIGRSHRKSAFPGLSIGGLTLGLGTFDAHRIGILHSRDRSRRVKNLKPSVHFSGEHRAATQGCHYPSQAPPLILAAGGSQTKDLWWPGAPAATHAGPVPSLSQTGNQYRAHRALSHPKVLRCSHQ